MTHVAKNQLLDKYVWDIIRRLHHLPYNYTIDISTIFSSISDSLTYAVCHTKMQHCVLKDSNWSQLQSVADSICKSGKYYKVIDTLEVPVRVMSNGDITFVTALSIIQKAYNNTLSDDELLSKWHALALTY